MKKVRSRKVSISVNPYTELSKTVFPVGIVKKVYREYWSYDFAEFKIFQTVHLFLRVHVVLISKAAANGRNLQFGQKLSTLLSNCARNQIDMDLSS